MGKIPSPDQIVEINQALDRLYGSLAEWLVRCWKGSKITDGYGWPKLLDDPRVWTIFEREMKSCGWKVEKEYVDDLWSERDKEGRYEKVPTLTFDKIK